MTRKRKVKLLMAIGYSRNYANEMADVYSNDWIVTRYKVHQLIIAREQKVND